LAVRFSTSDLPAIAVCVGLSRAVLTLDPVASVLAASLGAILFVRAVRAVLELGSPFVFAPLCAIIAATTNGWFAVVRESGFVHALGLPDGALFAAVARALSTAVAALVLGPWMAYLPGLTPLKRSSPWSSAASVR